MSTFLRTWPIALVIIVVFIGALANSRPAHAQTIGNGAGDSSITVMVMDYGDSGSTFNVVWNDSQECSADFNVYIYGTSEGSIHAGSAASSLTEVSASFDTIIAASGTGSLTVSVFCGTDDGTGRLVASASDVAVETDSGRPRARHIFQRACIWGHSVPMASCRRSAMPARVGLSFSWPTEGATYLPATLDTSSTSIQYEKNSVMPTVGNRGLSAPSS